ncbi:virion structural protein [Rhizobium phage RHEph22]|uniref:Uncharacterized protein n=1 Tax=Rhizobium phage RHEph22 TaxID=2836135 RepID=A0AAE7VN04_9CAUD|nr:virion structural protein [Rhizobium phage RHEph22]QXV74748.1 hypothetical protein [Rhizobium phage RHEph22]QXV74842.1 hypothetical protein [Rhizobium phage RHEph24]
MAPLTWREVSAPNFSSVNQAQALVGDSISNAANIMQKSIAAYSDQKTRENSANFMGQILNGTPLDQVQGVNPAYLDPEAFNFALNVQKQNEANALGYARLAQLGAKGGKGGKGTGAGTADAIPVAPGSSDGNFLTSENQIIPGVVTNAGTDPANTKGKKQLIPTAPVVVAPTQGVTQALPTVESFRPMPVDGPVRQSEEAAPVNAPVSVDPAPTGATSATPLLAQAIASGQGIIAPTAGALRGAPVKGTDGGAQIFPELAQDTGTIRNTAYSGDPELANSSAIMNKRLQNNLTSTNLLDLQEGNYKAAAAGQDFREGQRKEQAAVKSLNEDQQAEAIANAAVLQPTKQDALNSIDPNLPAKLWEKAVAKVNDADKAGQFGIGGNGPVQLPDGTIITPSANRQIDLIDAVKDASADPEVAKTIQSVAAKDGQAGVQQLLQKTVDNSSWLGRSEQMTDLQNKHDSVVRKYNNDRGANPLISSIADFEKNVTSEASEGEVAKQLAKDASVFSGREVTPGNMLTLVRQVHAQTKQSPAIVGGMISASFRDKSFWDKFRWGSTNADVAIDDDILQGYKDMVWDSKTNTPKNDFLNSVENLKSSDRERDRLNTDWEQYKQAQITYNQKAVQAGLKNNGQGDAAVKLAEKVLAASEQQYRKTYDKFTEKFGVTTQNRGEPAPPPLAPPTVRPQQGPRQGTVYQPNADELLRNAINQEMSIPALDNKRRLGVY